MTVAEFIERYKLVKSACGHHSIVPKNTDMIGYEVLDIESIAYDCAYPDKPISEIAKIHNIPFTFTRRIMERMFTKI